MSTKKDSHHPSKGGSSAISATPPLRLTTALTHHLDDIRNVQLSPTKHALQIVAMQARVWAADDQDVVCRPWYMLCLELYPRGKVINHKLHAAPAQPPNATTLFSFLLDHIHSPPEGERSIRPTHVSFVDPAVTALVAPHLARLKIHCDSLTLADGVMDYIKKFSTRLVEADRATRSEAAERASILSIPSITPPLVKQLATSSAAMYAAQPWARIPEHVALQIRLPTASNDDRYRSRFYVTVLGSDEKVFGFALLSSLNMLRDKYRRVMSKRTGNHINDVAPTPSDVFACASCGRRVGEDGPEHWANRCAGCHRLFYCDQTCQQNDWRHRHRDECADAKEDPQYIFKREQWAWLDREMALLFLDPTAIPFDDLDAFDKHEWPYIKDASPPLYPLPFISVQASDGITSRRDLPTEKEISIMTLVAQGLTECVSTPPADGVLHFANGVSVSLAENLAESIPV